MSRRRWRRGSQAFFAFAVHDPKCKKCGAVLPPDGPCGGCLLMERDMEQINAHLKEFPDRHCTKDVVKALALCETSAAAEKRIDRWIRESTARIREGWSEETFRERSGDVTVGVVSRHVEVGE
jgi:hypothetical protein